MKYLIKLLFLAIISLPLIACDNDIAYNVDDLDEKNTELYAYLLELESLYGKINVKTTEMEEEQKRLEEKIAALEEELKNVTSPEEKEMIKIKIEAVENEISKLANEEELIKLKEEVKNVKNNVRTILTERKAALEKDLAVARTQQEKNDIQKEIDKVTKQIADLDKTSTK